MSLTSKVKKDLSIGSLWEMNPITILLYVVSIVTVLYHLYYAFFFPVIRDIHANLHLMMLFAVFYLTVLNLQPSGRKDYLKNVTAVVLLAATLVTTIYVHFNYMRWMEQGRQMMIYTNIDLLVGLIIIISVIYATWVSFGRVLVLVIVGSLVYGWIGAYLPGLFGHPGFSIEDLIYMNTIQTEGVYGSLLGISATWVAVFVFFAGMMEGYGGMGAIIGLSKGAVRFIKSGAIQAAVVSSMLIGSIMASSTANTASTGSFTIPLMKTQGVRPKTAASIEAVVSNGGQILPPVMGSSAFIMAEIIGISYFAVLQGAFIPALFFYFCCFIIVHLLTLKHGWGSDEVMETLSTDTSIEEETTGYYQSLEKKFSVDYSGSGGRRRLYADLIPLVVGIGMLIVTLAVLRWSPLRAGAITIVLLLPTILLREIIKEKSISLEMFASFLAQTAEGCKLGCQNMAPITAVLASIGIVVTILSTSGFTFKVSLAILAIGVGLVSVLLLAMFASILFGMGLPTPAAYVIVAVFTAPALTEFGIEVLVAHMFVFYFAILSSITPPIAMASAVGAGIAGSKFWETAVESVRLGVFAFLIPYVYVFNQELILWNGIETWITAVVMLPGLFALCIALIGHNWLETIGRFERGVYGALAAIVLIFPVQNIQILAAGTIGALWLVRALVPKAPSLRPEAGR